jgi:hypothetical protein
MQKVGDHPAERGRCASILPTLSGHFPGIPACFCLSALLFSFLVATFASPDVCYNLIWLSIHALSGETAVPAKEQARFLGGENRRDIA